MILELMNLQREIEKRDVEIERLTGALTRISQEAKEHFAIDSEEYMAAPAGNPENCWAAPSRHLQTFSWIIDFIKEALAPQKEEQDDR